MAVLKRIPGRPNSPKLREMRTLTFENVVNGTLNKSIYEQADLTLKALMGEISGNDNKAINNFKTVLDRYAFTALAIEEAYNNALLIEENTDLTPEDIDDSAFNATERYGKYVNIHTILLCKVIKKIETDLGGIAYGNGTLILLLGIQAERESTINTDNIVYENMVAHNLLLKNPNYSLDYIDNIATQIIEKIRTRINVIINQSEIRPVGTVAIIDIISLFANVNIINDTYFSFNSAVSVEFYKPNKGSNNDESIMNQAIESFNERINVAFRLNE